MQEREQGPTLAETRQEVDLEFEKASLAMMRAFEAVQRHRSHLDDGSEEDAEAAELLDSYHDVAGSLHYVLRCCAVSPTGRDAVEVVAAALDRADIERVASDRVLHPPRRRAVIAGLTGLIDERTRQLEGLTERHVEHDPGTCISTAFTGITAAFRQVLRERDVLIDARDIV